MRKNKSENGFFPEDPSASTLRKPSGGVGDASHGHKDIGNHGTEQMGHESFFFGLGYLFFGMFCFRGIWDLRKKKRSWTEVKNSTSTGFGC